MPRQPRELTRVNPYDERGHLKAWARAITEELRALWCPDPSPPTVAQLLASIWQTRR